VRAIRYRAGRVELDDAATPPSPAQGEALVRLLRAGIGSRDHHAAASAASDRILGHEFVGIVEDVRPHADHSPDSPDALTATRVVGSIDEPCARCRLCLAGLGAHCPERRVLGLRSRDGCLAEHFILPAANLIPVPDRLDDDLAVFAQPVGAALHAARLVTCGTHGLVTVLGDGTLALLLAQALARSHHAVRLLGTDPARYALCERWGIRHRHADEVGRRRDQDAVVLCDPRPDAASLALQLVRPRGQVVLASPAPGPPALDQRPIVENELRASGARGCELQEATLALFAGWIDPLPLIARRVRLPDAPREFNTEPNALKTIIEP